MTRQPGGRPLLLVSDDEAHMLAAWARRSRQLGFDVVTDIASNAVELAKRYHPTGIVIDVMQKVSGLELLAVLKNDRATCEIPVVMVSARDDDEVRSVCEDLGAAQFILKAEDDLMAQVAAVITRAPQQSPRDA